MFLDPTQSRGKDGKGGLVGEAQSGTAGPWDAWWSRVRMGSCVSEQGEVPWPPQGQGDGDVPVHLAAIPVHAPTASRGIFPI